MFGILKPTKVVEMLPKEAHEKLSRGEITLIDVREPDECAKLRIAGAVNVPLTAFEAHMSRVATDKPVVFHCHSGMRSAKAIARCKAMGHAHQTHVSGGILAWKAAGLPVVAQR